jgi:recombination DNA repair RAD52 pathway protein
MGACLSAKFKKKNKVTPLLGSTTEFDDELIQRAKRYLKDQYQSSLQSSSTQTGPSLTNLQAMRNTLKLGFGVDRIAPGIKIQSVEEAAKERGDASNASEDSMQKRSSLNKNEEDSTEEEEEDEEDEFSDTTSDEFEVDEEFNITESVQNGQVTSDSLWGGN